MKEQELFGEGNWSYAVDYGVGGKGPLDPSFNFCVEVCDNSKLIASYYHHLVVQRRVSLYTLPSLYDSCGVTPL
jgi:hypothetical protein